MRAMNSKMGSLEFEDGNGPLGRMILGPGIGDFALSDFVAGQYEDVVIEDRGEYVETIPGSRIYQQGSVKIYQDGSITSIANRKVYDGVMNAGMYADPTAAVPGTGITTDPGGLVWLGNVIWRCNRGIINAGFTMSNCRMKLNFGEQMSGNQLSLSWIIRGAVTPV